MDKIDQVFEVNIVGLNGYLEISSNIRNRHPGRNNGEYFSGIKALTAVKISHRSRY